MYSTIHAFLQLHKGKTEFFSLFKIWSSSSCRWIYCYWALLQFWCWWLLLLARLLRWLIRLHLPRGMFILIYYHILLLLSLLPKLILTLTCNIFGPIVPNITRNVRVDISEIWYFLPVYNVLSSINLSFSGGVCESRNILYDIERTEP